MLDLVHKLYTAADLPDAYIVLNLLTQAHIEVRVFNENAQGGLGEIPFTHAYPEVWLLDEADMERANKVIENYESSEVEGDVYCTGCHEENPANFQYCWNCGELINERP